MLYGDGQSETNLGRVLQKLKPAGVVVGTKVRVPPGEVIAEAITKSLEGSLARLRLERVDILHLHNPITATGGGSSLSVRPGARRGGAGVRTPAGAGKIRFSGISALGDTAALHRLIDARAFDSAQIVYNMLNPSAAGALPANYPAQDYGRLFDHTKAAGVGVVGIRVLAGGALSGSAARHPIAGPAPEPIGSAMGYDADIDRARRLMPLVEEGFAASLTEAATRFALSSPRRWARSWSGWPRRNSSKTRWPQFKKARCRKPPSTGSWRCSRDSPANRADRGAALHLSRLRGRSDHIADVDPGGGSLPTKSVIRGDTPPRPSPASGRGSALPSWLLFELRSAPPACGQRARRRRIRPT